MRLGSLLGYWMPDEISLVGPEEHVRARLQAWRDCPVTTLLSAARDVTTLRLLAEAAL